MKEIFVTLRNGEFTETYDEPSTKELHKYFDGYGINFLEGQEAEVNLNAAGWLAEAGRVLKRGLILTIDYGFLAPSLYSPERMSGTYKCMYMHNLNDEPYVNIGRQDITAHVDFSNLIRSGEALGLHTVKYTPQGQFLIDWGVLGIMERESGNTDAPGHGRNMAIKNLFLPGSMGSSFKVLLQSKNIDAEDFYPESPFKLSFGII
jgi:SAM-dependent MidA family methyltransferase